MANGRSSGAAQACVLGAAIAWAAPAAGAPLVKLGETHSFTVADGGDRTCRAKDIIVHDGGGGPGDPGNGCGHGIWRATIGPSVLDPIATGAEASDNRVGAAYSTLGGVSVPFVPYYATAVVYNDFEIEEVEGLDDLNALVDVQFSIK